MSNVEVEVGTKRSGEYDEYGEVTTFKKPKTDAKMRLLVVGKSCGAIIGKGGENIKKLRQSFGIKINVQDARAEGVVTLAGDKESVISVFKEILPLISEPPYPVNRKQKSNMAINLLVQTDQVGSVLGKGGEKVKEIRQESGANMRIYKDFMPNSNERIVAIGGEDGSNLLNALDIVLQTIEDHPLKKGVTVRQYDPRNSDNDNSGNNQSDMGAQNQLGGGLGLGALGGLGGLGGLGNLAGLNNLTGAASILGQLGLATGPMGNDQQVPATYNQDRGKRDQHSGRQGDGSQFGDMETETKITVLNDMCGAIIGKSGQRIREIRQTSGARVDFTETPKGSKEPRVITIKGTQKQIVIAQQMMDDSVRNRNK